MNLRHGSIDSPLRTKGSPRLNKLCLCLLYIHRTKIKAFFKLSIISETFKKKTIFHKCLTSSGNKKRKPVYFGMKQIRVLISLEWIISLLVLSAAYVLALSGFGPALSCDSANYLSVASNLVQGNGFVQFDGFHYLNATPLYPILLSPAYLLGMNPITWAAILNYLLLITAVMIGAMQLQHFIRKNWLTMALPIVFFPYTTFVSNGVWVLSEMLFIALLMAFIWNFHRSLNNQKSMIHASILLSLLLISRFTGLLILPGVVVLLFLHKTENEIVNKTKVLLLALIPLLIWIGRNYVISGLPLGQHNLIDKIQLAPYLKATPMQWIMALLGIGCWIYSGIHLKGYPAADERKKFLSTLFWLISSYLFFLLIQGNIRTQQWPRLLSPMWIPLSLYGLIYLQLIWDEFFHIKFIHNLIPALVMLFALIQPGLLIIKALSMKKNGTGGYATAYWKGIENGEIELHLNSEKPLSNLPDLIWLKTGKDAYHARFINEPETDFLSRISEPRQLIWFKTEERVDLLMPISAYQLWLLNFGKESDHIISFGLRTTPVNTR